VTLSDLLIHCSVRPAGSPEWSLMPVQDGVAGMPASRMQDGFVWFMLPS